MEKLNEFGIQRELIAIEEKLTDVRNSFSSYAAGDEVDEIKEFDEIINRIRALQLEIREWFAP